MAVAHDAATEFTGSGTSVGGTHTPVGTPRGVWVYVAQTINRADIITGVTYGGVAMTRANFVPNDDQADDGGVYSYFLGSSIPTGAQTVTVSKSDGTTAIHVVCCTCTAAADTELVDEFGQSSLPNSATPEAPLTKGGRTTLDYVGMWNNNNAVANITDKGGQTRIHDHDFTNEVSTVSRVTTPTSADTTPGFTTAGTQIYALTVVAIGEVAGGGAIQPPRTYHQHRQRRAA
jgi:hypothetical protein